MRRKFFRRARFVAPLVLAMTAGLFVSPVAAAPFPPPATVPTNLGTPGLGWSKVFEDEFTTLDETKWKIQEGRGAARDAVSTSGGFLTLKTYTEDGATYSGGIVGDGNDRAPHGLFNATYGYIEARIKFQNESGTSSDLWTLSSSGDRGYDDGSLTGPESGFEHTSNKNNNGADQICNAVTDECNTQPVGLLGWNGYLEHYQSISPAGGGRVPNPDQSPSNMLHGNFHTYGLLWAPEGWHFYIDGIEVFTTREALTNRPEFLLLTQQHSDDSFKGPMPPMPAGYGDKSTSTNMTVVDWVRVWQRPVSDVPDQVLGMDDALAIPFHVTDYNYSEPGLAEPPTVRVTAESSNTTLLPTNRIAVTGNLATGTPDADGNFSNGTLEGASSGWTFAPTANGSVVTGSKAHSGTKAMRLQPAGSKATRTVTGLQPNTTYVMGQYTDLEVEWTDTDSDGKIDWTDTNKDGIYQWHWNGPTNSWVADETGEVVTDGFARLDWGISDVDSARAGAQRVSKTMARNWWQLEQNRWMADYLTFTTGPTTTSVELFEDNVPYAGSVDNDARAWIDDIYLRPITVPDRTVTVRPVEGQHGESTVTLRAFNGATEIGTDTFKVTVNNRSNFANGGFEAQPLGARWDIQHPAEVVTLNPFTLNRGLRLGKGSISTVFQHLTGLASDTEYRVELSGQVEPSTAPGDPVNDIAFGGINPGTGGTSSTINFNSTTWATANTTFRTGPTSTTADVVIVDWDTVDGGAVVDNVSVKPVVAQTQTTVAPPELTALGEQQLTAGVPAAVRFDLSGKTVTSISSDNDYVLPARNIAVNSASTKKVLSLTPMTDRTGTATIRVNYNITAGGTGFKDIPVVVSHEALASPGFEAARNDRWVLPGSGASFVGGGAQRSGALALQVDTTATVKQSVQTVTPGGDRRDALTFDRAYVVGAWGKAGARITVKELGYASEGQSDLVLGTLDFSGAAYTKQQMVIHTRPKHCVPCGSQRPRIEVIVTDTTTGDVAVVDDLYLLHGPAMSPIRDLALKAGQTSPDWTNETTVRVGRIPTDTIWGSSPLGAAAITSSDPTVVPLTNIALERNADYADSWRFRIKGGTKTGTSVVTLTLTDPRSGATEQRSFDVSVSAGSFNNGSFQRDTNSWGNAWFADFGIKSRAYGWPPNSGLSWPRDDNDALFLTQGWAVYQVTGLQASTQYRLRGNARGSGSQLVAYRPGPNTAEPWWPGTEMSHVDVTNAAAWQSYTTTFTTDSGQTSVWIALKDTDDTTPAGTPSIPACDSIVAGATCFDDVGLFLLSDVP